MAVEATMKCDGIGCGEHIHMVFLENTMHTFVEVNDKGSRFHFCSWKCLAGFAQAQAK